MAQRPHSVGQAGSDGRALPGHRVSQGSLSGTDALGSPVIGMLWGVTTAGSEQDRQLLASGPQSDPRPAEGLSRA